MNNKALNSKSVAMSHFDGFVGEKDEAMVLCKMWNELFLELRLEVKREKASKKC